MFSLGFLGLGSFSLFFLGSASYAHIEVVVMCFQSFPYKSLPLGPIWTIFGRMFPTGVPQLLYPYKSPNPLAESFFEALTFQNV